MVKRIARQMKIRAALPMPLILLIVLFSVLFAWGEMANLQPTNTLGDAMLNAFGGCMWSEEVDVHEIISWMMVFIPSGLAACVVLSQNVFFLQAMTGYRYRRPLQWYTAIMRRVLLTTFLTAAVQVACVLLFAVCTGHTGWAVWIEDADGFTVQTMVQPCLAPVLFMLYDALIVLMAAVVFLITRKMTWYYGAFLLPSLLGAFTCSNIDKTSLYNPIHFGMARRLSVEGSTGVMPAVAVGGMAACLLMIFIIGLVFCQLTSPFDRMNE